MLDHLHIRPDDITPIADPDTDGQLWIHPDAFGQAGVPYMIKVSDPPHTTRPRHSHHGDVCYLYVQGEHHIAGEGVYRSGDVRWTRAGHIYGPETTGPEGGTWWLITDANPIPVNHPTTDDSSVPRHEARADAPPATRVGPDTPLDDLVESTREPGAIIVEGWLDAARLAGVNREIDEWLAAHPQAGLPDSGSELYDRFLGHRTLRLHGLAHKLPRWGPELIADPFLVEWATRALDPVATSVLLNAGELIQIGAGETAQYLHRDSDSWPALPVGDHPVVVNAIIALDDCTIDNGATHVAPGSHRWPASRQANPDELTRATMRAGDVLLFRGDLVHGGGANLTDRRRRVLSISYCSGWLRPVENHAANIPADTIASFEPALRGLLGAGVHDATSRGGGVLGLVDGTNPTRDRTTR